MKSWSAKVVVARRAGALAVLGAAAQVAWGGYEPPDPAYAPPTHYYDSASGTGLTLRTNLHNIITSGFVARSYGDSRYSMATEYSSGASKTSSDQDPNNAGNIILLYNRASIPGAWDMGATWNREHVWPKFWLDVTSSQVSNSYKGPASDLFELRPANPNINSSRSNSGYGFYPYTSGSYGNNSNGGTTYWYPGTPDTGDVARTIFYMATRYFDPANPSRGTDIQNLDIKNGEPTKFNMGDLNSLLHWNYSDGVDNFERNRNQYIYGSSGDLTNHALNPTYYQGNRNPFIDHPEYVWAVFGGGNNNSQVYVGAAPSADGSSAATVDLGRAIVGATLPTGTVTVNKAGTNPTTFDVTASGVAATAASALQVGTGQPFDYNNVTRTMTVGLTASTATAGVKTGTVTLNNTDLTSSGAGHGSADGNDTVSVTATVVDHSIGSLAAGSTVKAQTLDFGYVPQGFAARSASFAIANRLSASGYTADLALNSTTNSGSGAFTTDAATFAHLAAGSQNTYTATLSTGTTGALSATHTFNVSDEAIPGATAGAPLVLTTTARVITHGDFPVSGTLNLHAGETFATGPSSIAAGVTLVKDGPGTLDVNGPQDNGAGSTLDVAGGTVLLGTDAGSNLAVVVDAGGYVQVQSAQHLASLTAANGSPRVDLLGNAVTIASADPESLRLSLLTGTITSTLPDLDGDRSIGYVPAGGASGYLLQLTYTGDANLDGVVNADDYALIDRGIARDLSGWVAGDFDYDGAVDMADYLLIDTTFSRESGGTLSAALLADREARFGPAYVSELVAMVPEPSSVLGVAAVALLFGGRRRRRA